MPSIVPKTNHIRPTAICIIRRHNEILVGEATDSVKGEVYYRPPGGGINYGEPAREAVVREIKEEIGVELTNVRQTGVLENIFTHEGKRGHEIVFLFEAEFADRSLYEFTEWSTALDFCRNRALKAIITKNTPGSQSNGVFGGASAAGRGKSPERSDGQGISVGRGGAPLF